MEYLNMMKMGTLHIFFLLQNSSKAVFKGDL